LCFYCSSTGGQDMKSGAHADPLFWWPAKKVGNYTALLHGSSWVDYQGKSPQGKPVFITYSFQSQKTDADADALPPGTRHWKPFSSKDKADARSALKQWEKVSGIKFLETKEDHGDIQFSWNSQKDSYGLGYYPLANETSWYLNVASDYIDLSGNIYLDLGTRSRFKQEPSFKKYTLLHEIGHALGLKHPFGISWWNERTLTESRSE
jgi:hypothetical protein